MNEKARGLAALASVVAIFLAALVASIPIPSECSSRDEIHVFRALVPFALFVAAGGYVMWRGSPGHRLFVFLGAAVAVAGYVGALSLTLPMLAESGCGFR